MPITHGATSPGAAAFAASLSIAHTCAAGTRVLFVPVLANNNRSIVSVTFNGVPLTPVETGSAFQRLYALTAPFIGTANVVITLSDAEAMLAYAVSYLADQPVTISGVQASAAGDSAPSVTVASAAGARVVGMSSYIDLGGNTLQTAGAGQTSRGSAEQSGHYLIVSDEPGASDGVIHSYTRNGGFYYHQRIIAVSIAEVGGGGGGSGSTATARRRRAAAQSSFI